MVSVVCWDSQNSAKLSYVFNFGFYTRWMDTEEKGHGVGAGTDQA